MWVMTGYAAPLLDAKDTWNRNIFAPVVKTACSSGQCWGWLPISETSDDNIIIPKENGDILRYTHAHVTHVLCFLLLVFYMCHI